VTKQGTTFTANLIRFKTVFKNYKTSGLYHSENMQDVQWLHGSAMPVLDTIHKIYRNKTLPLSPLRTCMSLTLLISKHSTSHTVHIVTALGQTVTKLWHTKTEHSMLQLASNTHKLTEQMW